MTKAHKILGLVLSIVAGLGIAVLIQHHPKPEAPAKAEKHPTTFPTHLAGFMPEAPPTCHSIYQKKADGTLEFLMQHDILDDQGGPVDMRHLTAEQWEAVIQTDYSNDKVRLGMQACSGVGPDWFFPSAYAQPHCTECGGDGCASWTCPGHFVTQACALGGGSCVVTIICCTGDCTPTC